MTNARRARSSSSPAARSTLLRRRRPAWPAPWRRPCATASRNWPWRSCRRCPWIVPKARLAYLLGVGRRGFDADLRPIGVELFGDDGGKAGVGALAHLEMLGDHRDAVVRRDAQEGVRRKVAWKCQPARGVNGPGPVKADGETGGGRGRRLSGMRVGSTGENGCRFADVRLSLRSWLSPPSCERPHGLRRGCADRSRSGRCCRASRRRCRHRSVLDFVRAAPSPT